MLWKLFARLVRISLVSAFFFLDVSGVYAASPSPPPVDREAAEEAFISGYEFFLANRLWNTLDLLQRAQEENIYFIDAYFLKSLVLRRLGMYPDAIAAMSSYIEVRRDDFRGEMILDSMKREWDIISGILNSDETGTNLLFRGYTARSLLGVSIIDPASFAGMLGLGKVNSYGSDILLCDMVGNRLWVFDRDGRHPEMSMEFINPVVAIPTAPSDSILLLKSGDVLSLRTDARSGTISARPMGSVSANVADAVTIDSTLMAVADRTGQAVRFYRTPSLESVTDWRPADSEETDKLFEPVALAAFGPFLAVADRGNSRVFVIDSFTLSVLDTFEADLPRDVEWGMRGELYTLSENGTLYSMFPMTEVSPDITTVAANMKNAWSITWSDTGPIMTDITGRLWWSGSITPGYNDAFGIADLRDPWIAEGEEGGDTLMLRGVASSIYSDFIRGKIPDTNVIWRDEVRPSRVTRTATTDGGGIRFYSVSRPGGGSSREVTEVASLNGVMEDIARISRSGGEIPKVLVLDTSIAEDDDRVNTFLGFLLHQGIRLDLWVLNRPPSASMSRISRMTKGRSYFTAEPGVVPLNENIEWILSIPLPDDASTFGYPSEITLSLFSNIDIVSFADWLPIWPSLMERRRVD
ncbi:MAG: hypothetical protein LBI74_03470 [Synergistaceae bacterium]|jgi:hypothetical protein|nr:hypothetical protein [Synergistaceae bacterium]